MLFLNCLIRIILMNITYGHENTAISLYNNSINLIKYYLWINN